MTADDLPEISRPAQAALHAAGIRTLDEVARYTERELLQMHGDEPEGRERSAWGVRLPHGFDRQLASPCPSAT